MITYIFRSMWQQKRSNLFIILEMFGLFVALFFGLLYTIKIMKPKFEPTAFHISNNTYFFHINNYRPEKNTADIKEFIEQLPDVDNVSLSLGSVPYSNKSRSGTFSADVLGEKLRSKIFYADANFPKLFGLETIQGKWFQGEKYTGRIPIVVTDDFAKQLPKKIIGLQGILEDGNIQFQGSLDDIAKGKHSKMQGLEVEIVAVTKAYRNNDFKSSKAGVFIPTDAVFKSNSDVHLVVEISGELKNHAPVLQLINDFLEQEKWSVIKLAPVTELRDQVTRSTTIEMQRILLMLACLLLLLALGLSGIFGYKTRQRASELSVYRALGASAKRVQRQLIGEMLVLVLMGILPAILITLQVPLLGFYTVMGDVLLAILFSSVVIFCMVIVSVYFPSKQVFRLEPSVALKAE